MSNPTVVIEDKLNISFDILSLNTREIRDNLKRRKVFEWLKNHFSKESIIFIQESHSAQDIERLWSLQWLSKEKVIFSHGEFNACGVLIGFGENLDYEIKDNY